MPTLHMRFCTIRDGGIDDLSPTFSYDHSIQDLLFCEWCTPVVIDGVLVRRCWVAASWLRKVSGPGVDLAEVHSAPASREAVPA
jgi:hypothetical protein